MLIFGIATVLALASYAFYKRHYVLALSNAVIGMYEFCAPVFFEVGGVEDLVPLMRFYEARATETKVFDHIQVSISFVIAMNLAYALAPRVRALFSYRTNWRDSTPRTTDFRHYYILMWMVFALGVISTLSDSGNLMLRDYLGDENVVTPAFWYGTILTICVAPLFLYAFLNRWWATIAVLFIAVAPLALQIFISSRRQFLAPLFIFGLLYFLYGENFRRKFLWTTSFVLAAIVFSGLQANMRTAYVGELTHVTSDYALPLAAQLNEFVAGGTITLSAIALVDVPDRTHFGQFLVLGVANSVPYIKFGTLLFPEYVDDYRDRLDAIAPIGGLTTVAEAYLSGGLIGVVLIAAVIGIFTALAHDQVKRFFGGRFDLPIHRTYFVCLVCILLLKYRSGFTDAYLSFINFTILFYFAAALHFVLYRNQPLSSTAASGGPQEDLVRRWAKRAAG